MPERERERERCTLTRGMLHPSIQYAHRPRSTGHWKQIMRVYRVGHIPLFFFSPFLSLSLSLPGLFFFPFVLCCAPQISFASSKRKSFCGSKLEAKEPVKTIPVWVKPYPIEIKLTPNDIRGERENKCSRPSPDWRGETPFFVYIAH